MGTARFQLRSQMAIAGDRRGIRMTYRLLSEEAEISTSTLSRMATNEQKMVSLAVLERLCNTLGCTPNDLLWVEADEPPTDDSPVEYHIRPATEIIRES